MKFTWCAAALTLVLLSSALIGGQAGSTLRSTSGQPSVAEFSDQQTLLVFAHQDDDLLWMLPFWPVADKFLLAAYPAMPTFDELIKSFPPRLNYRAR